MKNLTMWMLAMVVLLLTSCGGKSQGEASGSNDATDNPKALAKVAEAVMLCEGIPLERSVFPKELQEKVIEKNNRLRPVNESGELIGVEIPTEGREEFFVGIDSLLKIKELQPGYGGSQWAVVKLETVIKIIGEGVPHNTAYYAVGFDGDEPVVTFQFQSGRMVQGEKYAEYYTEGDRVRLTREVKIDPANAARYARVEKFIVTVEEDPAYQEADEAMYADREEYIKKYGR